MQNESWDNDLDQLGDAADRVATLARCLAVGTELRNWRDGDDIAGMSAADALDQARGDLERLVSGEAAALLGLVQRVVKELPAPLE
ncbi:hypothetical protein [Nocardioides sp.]|uniref:hypothetical protein n=1 Tax=Nocardioides sp. TaxID=35761 RepID=UPI0035ADF7BC